MSLMVDQVVALHHDMPNLANFDVYVCAECGKTQPCPTIRAVESEQILVSRRDDWCEQTKGHTYHWISETEVVR